MQSLGFKGAGVKGPPAIGGERLGRAADAWAERGAHNPAAAP